MRRPSRPASHGSRRMLACRSFPIVAATLAAITLLHYLTPQTRSLLPQVGAFLRRHAVERILFLLPIAIAAFALGATGGLVTLVLVVLIMLPRAIWVSPYPADAIIETAATAVIGGIVIWMIETLAREKALRQEAVSRLSAVNAITAIMTGSLELEQVLHDALDKILEVMGLEAGLIYLVDRETHGLTVAAYEGISEDAATELDHVGAGEGPWGEIAQSGQPVVAPTCPGDPLALQRDGLHTQVVVPLRSKDEVQGLLALAARSLREFTPEESELITAISRAIGVAVENARLYESTRFYTREVIRAQEEERKRIARELHDETIQALVVISRRIEGLATLPEPLPEPVRHRLASLQDLVGSTLRGVRRFAQDLRPPTLDHLGLVATVEGLASSLTVRDGIETDVRVTGEAQRLMPEEELALFRIVQEALSNVRRHSRASRATVDVEFLPGRVRLVVGDDGRGFTTPRRFEDLVSTGRLGLVGMQERMRTLGGTLAIESEPGRGTVLIVDMPLKPWPAGAGSIA